MTDDEILAAADAIIAKRIEALGDLWVITKEDWYLDLTWCLTEPVCPQARIAPEGSNALRFAFIRDTPIAALMDSINAVQAAIIDGKDVPFGAPWTNPDDRERWPEVE